MFKSLVNDLLEILNNSGISALIGAFAAFILVMFTDFIRSYKKKSNIKRLLMTNQDLCKKKLLAIKNYRKLLKEGVLAGDRLIPFTSNEVIQLKLEAIKRFNHEELAALQSISYNMEYLDDMISNTAKEAEFIRQNPEKNNQYKIKYILQVYEDLIPNLLRLNELIEGYLNNQFEKVLSKKYKTNDYLSIK